MQSENSDLFARITQQRQEIEAIVLGLESAVGDLDTAITSLPQEEMLALTGETVAMDQAVRAAG